MKQRKKVIALGFFDGVHRGHGALLSRVRRRAEELDGIPSAVTFDTHPSAVITGTSVPLINTVADRIGLMRRCYGIEQVTVAHFDRHMMQLPWEEFITGFLVGEQNVGHVVCGHDFHFGYHGEGDPQRLKEFCARLGMGCDVIPKVEKEGITVSSTYIRMLIAEGQMERAVDYLGHPHVLTGEVIHGKQLGRTIGIPTANLALPDGVAVPAFGVYASKVILPDGTEQPAVTNVGVRPTVDDDNRITVEPWILGYEGDLYGQEIRLEFYKHLRGERRFSGLNALQEEIHRNAEETLDYFRTRKEQDEYGTER